MLHDNPENETEDDEHADHCTCGLETTEAEATLDVELPPASGGVHIAEESGDDAENEEHIDCCDIDFTAVEPTTDEELPITVGGM
jgi:hypothetical protein